MDMAPLPEHVREALLVGAVAPELLPPVEHAAEIDAAVETAFTRLPDGEARVFVLTHMPGVTPAMWEWWFGWHGSDAGRYRLWHPRAHVSASWADGEGDLGRYVGRTSNVVEYIGAERLSLSIRFVRPAELGFDERRLAERGEVAICARGSLTGTPMETGWLVHHLRPVKGGAQMRSRFWIGGANVRPRNIAGGLGRAIGRVAARLSPRPPTGPSDLLEHCAQEMNHLAALLPALYERHA